MGPYIADKTLFKATMFACKLLRNGNSITESCRIAGGYYGIDEDDVMKQVRLRRAAAPTKSRGKFHWFICCRETNYWDGGNSLGPVRIRKAKKKENLEWFHLTDGGSDYSSTTESEIIYDTAFNTKAEAEKEIKSGKIRKWINDLKR